MTDPHALDKEAFGNATFILMKAVEAFQNEDEIPIREAIQTVYQELEDVEDPLERMAQFEALIMAYVTLIDGIFLGMDLDPEARYEWIRAMSLAAQSDGFPT